MAAQKRRGISSAETSSGGSATQLSALGSAPGTLTDELAALFECPVCFEIVLPPIMQCQVGHLVCASCRPKLSCCPTCRGTLGNIRNLAMEKVANNLMFPCKHKSTGCRMSLGLNEKAEHEEVCEFRPYSCPCPGASCSWQGQLDKVMVHLQHSHKNITTLNGEDIVFLATEINLAGAVDWVMMQSCFGHHFMLVLEKQEKSDGHTQFFAIVQLIGSRKQAERFAYRLELNGNRRRLIWEAMPRSSHEGVASAIMGSDCLVFDNSIAQHFADNGNLGLMWESSMKSGISTIQKCLAQARFDANKSTKGASKLRRDLINAEIANLRELLPLPPSTRQRLSQLQLMALVCVYVRKANYFQQAFKCQDVGLHQTPTPNIGFSKALSGFLMMMTQNGKLLYISDNAAEYLGHSMVSVIKEDLLIHGDSVYDIIDKQDHQAIQCELGRPVVSTGTNNNAQEESRLFLCRMNVSRNARRQMRFGDQKVVLVQGRYLSFLPLCSRNEPVFLATCTPVAMPETRECVVQGATNVFTSIHSMDMRYIHIDSNGEFYLGFPRSELQGVSWYRLLHWDCTREAQTKHRLITQSEQERSCILLAQIQRRSGDWLWMHCVLQVKESAESNQQPVIVCTNQVLSEAEAAVMRTNGWLYHYYSVQNKLHYGLAYDAAHPASRLLYYPEHGGHGTSEFGGSHDVTSYPHLAAMPVSLQTQLTTHHAGAATHAHHNQHHHHHHHRRAESEPVDYSYGKRKPKDMNNLVLDVETATETDAGGGGDGLLVISHLSERPRTLLKVDPHDLIEQWNPSPPWSDTLQKVPDLCHQELSPYVGSTPPTPTATPSMHAGAAFSFDWMPEQFVPSLNGTPVLTGSVDEAERQPFWPPVERQLFPLQPPPKRNHPSTGRSKSADRDTP